jgi:hypothetical protein
MNVLKMRTEIKSAVGICTSLLRVGIVKIMENTGQ